MSQFYVHLSQTDRMAMLIDIDFHSLVNALPITPDNVLFLSNVGEHASFDNRLCAFYTQGAQTKKVFSLQNAPQNLSFVDYKNNARPYISEKEFSRFLQASEHFFIVGNPFSPTLDNQYLYMNKNRCTKLYLKNLDRFCSILAQLMLKHLSPLQSGIPLDSATLQQLFSLGEKGAIFRFPDQGGCDIVLCGAHVPIQIESIMDTHLFSDFPHHTLSLNKAGKWKISSQ